MLALGFYNWHRHAHSDHYTNLSSNWKSGPIYCSEDTANLIILMLKVDPKWVCPLPMNETSLIPDTGGVSVTLIEANHCEYLSYVGKGSVLNVRRSRILPISL